MMKICGCLLLAGGALGMACALPAPAKVIPGAAVFQEKGCTQCHGPVGLGTDKGPSLAGVGKKLRREQIEQQIREGGGAMPAFGEVLEPGEITDLSAWLETWKQVPKKKR